MRNSKITTYEKAFAEYFGAPAAFSFWKGRVAMYAILHALGIGPDDEIILPGYTCVMDVTPVMYLGAKPVYVDIEPQSYNIDITRLQSKITSRTKVIVAQHTYGFPCDMDAVMQIANDKNVTVIEDCCLSFGSKYKGKVVGTFGAASYFSSQWNKPYTTGLGGMALINDAELAEKVDDICQKEALTPPASKVFMLWAQLMIYRGFIYPRTTALATKTFRWLSDRGLIIGSTTNIELEKPVMPPDFFMRMSAVQARAGIRQLRKVEKNIQHRKRIAGLYDELLADKGWRVKAKDGNQEPVLVRYPVRITGKDVAMNAAAKAGIELGNWFISPLHNQIEKIEMYDYCWGMCPEAEKAACEVVNLPLHRRVSERTARKTVEFVCNFERAI